MTYIKKQKSLIYLVFFARDSICNQMGDAVVKNYIKIGVC